MLPKYPFQKFDDDLAFLALSELDEIGAIILQGIDQRAVDTLYAEIEAFFRSPLKERYNLGRENWGYFPLETPLRGGCSREAFEINDIFFDADDDTGMEKLEALCLDRFPRGKWPTSHDFPHLQYAFTALYGSCFSFCGRFLPGVSQGSLSAFRYDFNPKESFKIGEHEDDAHVIAFTPRGEPLEVFVRDQWVAEPLEEGEVLLIRPGIPHRVSNFLPQERYSLTFSYPEMPF